MPRIRAGPLTWLLALLAVFLMLGEPAIVFADEEVVTTFAESPGPPTSVEPPTSLFESMYLRPTDAWRWWT